MSGWGSAHGASAPSYDPPRRPATATVGSASTFMGGSGGRGVSGEIVQGLAAMMQDEPVVRQAISVLQHHCLSGGLHLRFGMDPRTHVPPTPSFARHLDYYYLQDAIQSFLAVGFAPYRLRRVENGARVPEVLPLGTYGWHVGRNPALMPRSHVWWNNNHNNNNNNNNNNNGRVPTATTRNAAAAAAAEKEGEPLVPDGPLLRYEVNSAYCKDPVHVYAFEAPHPFFTCTSRLASALPAYSMLKHKRECMLRADQFNSQPSIVFEQADKAKVNDIAKGGMPVLSMGSNSEASDRESGEKQMIGGRQNLHYDVLDQLRERSRIPEDSVALIAPTNHMVHSLDRVLSPQDLIRDELGFTRSLGGVLGLPVSLLLQGSGAVGSSSSSGGGASGSGQSWSESSESNNRMLLDTCRHINRHLEQLLCEVYAAIYGGAHCTMVPVFRIVALPTVNVEQLLMAFNARIIDDAAFSAMLESSWGTPLGEHAVAAREEQRKAEYVLPFRDKKEPPKKKAK